MKTAKLVCGIISIVLFMVISLQSCAAGVVEAIDGSGTSGGAGMIVAVIMLIAGIVGISTRKSKGGGIFCGVLYGFAALMGFVNSGVFADLAIWSGLCVIFALIFLIGSAKMPSKKKNGKFAADKEI